MARLLLCAVILAFCGPAFQAGGQNAKQNKKKQSNQQNQPAQPATPEQQAAKLRGKWIKAFGNARNDLQITGDRETAAFCGSILESLDQPNGMSPTALAANGERIKTKVRELVRRGALESAATLNLAQVIVLGQSGLQVGQPRHPTRKTGGTPGPGGLVLYLPFDDPGQNGLVRDVSGAGNDGRVYGANWVAGGGRFGGAYHFSITNLTDRIVIPDSDLLNPGYITMAAWIKTGNMSGFWSRIFDKNYTQGYDFCLGGKTDNNWFLGKPMIESSLGGCTFDQMVVDNHWHHVAATTDGKTIHCYVDGKEAGHPAKNPAPLKKNTWDLCIGNSVVDYADGAFLGYDGLIDEVRIYNRALSADEIKLLATATQAGVDVVPAPRAETGAKAPVAERLKQVKALFDQGLISKEDYDQKVKEIMQSL